MCAEQHLVFDQAGEDAVAVAVGGVEIFPDNRFDSHGVPADPVESMTDGVEFGGMGDDHDHHMRGCPPTMAEECPAAHEQVMDSVIARMIPAGTTVDEVYWALPTSYSTGDRFDSEEAALEAGIARKRQELAGRPCSSILVERFSVDLRWTVSWPMGGDRSSGSDFVVDRRTYDSLGDAVEHLARIRRVAGLNQEGRGR